MSKNKNREDSPLIIKNSYFSENENNLKQYIKYASLGRICFINCSFENMFSPGVIGSCSFENCKFINFNATKCLFSNCKFKNCQIINCQMRRLQLTKSSFTNCEFVKVDLAASDFFRCKFEETNFIEGDLSKIFASNVQIWKSNNLIEVENNQDFKELLIDTNCT